LQTLRCNDFTRSWREYECTPTLPCMGRCDKYQDLGTMWCESQEWHAITNRWSNRAGAGAPTPRGGRGEEEKKYVRFVAIISS
jgi:hypothetical protein